MFKPSQPRMRHTYCSASTTLRQTPVVEGQPNKKGKPNNVSTSDKKLKALLAKELAACSADSAAAEDKLTLFGKKQKAYACEGGVSASAANERKTGPDISTPPPTVNPKQYRMFTPTISFCKIL